MTSFEIISDITDTEVIAIGKSIRDLERLREQYGDGRWRKMKGLLLSNSQTDAFAKLKFTGMKRTVLDEKSSNAKAIWNKKYDKHKIYSPFRNLR